MTKLVITEKHLSKRRVCEIVDSVYKNHAYTIKYKRGSIYLFFPNKDLTQEHVAKIASKLHMETVYLSYVRATIGY